MAYKIHNFVDSLKKGKEEEAKFVAKCAGKLTQLEGKKSDFKVNENGLLLELKSDFYDMEKTPNFFFERYSNWESKSPGGPWQAKTHDSKYYCYRFVNNDKTFLFDVVQLTAFLDTFTETLQMKEVRNKTWTTKGYAVPRAAVAHLELDFEKEILNKSESSATESDDL